MVPKINPYKRPHKVYLEGNWPTEPKKVPGYVRNNYPIFLEASDEHGGPIRVAIVCPQTIYGLGRGPGNKRSQQLYDLARIILSNGKGVRVGKGENRQTHVHIHDLSDIFVALVEEAAAGGGKATWGREGYYFASRNDHAWGDVASSITSYAYQNGLISSNDVSEFTSAEFAKSAGHSHAALIFGGNAREETIRARRLLGWTPSRGSIFDEVPAAVESEAAQLGIVGRGDLAKKEMSD